MESIANSLGESPEDPLVGGSVLTIDADQQYVLFQASGEPLGLGEGVAPATARTVVAALAALREDLRVLRERRALINDAIRVRVVHESYLERMAKLAQEVLKEVTNDDDEGTGSANAVDA